METTFEISQKTYDKEGFSNKVLTVVIKNGLYIVHKTIIENNSSTSKDFTIKENLIDITKCFKFQNEKFDTVLEALTKLISLRNLYNEGWNANWDNYDYKYYIFLKSIYPIKFVAKYTNKIRHVLSFKNVEIANKFLREQIELLEIAEPLL